MLNIHMYFLPHTVAVRRPAGYREIQEITSTQLIRTTKTDPSCAFSYYSSFLYTFTFSRREIFQLMLKKSQSSSGCRIKRCLFELKSLRCGTWSSVRGRQSNSICALSPTPSPFLTNHWEKERQGEGGGRCRKPATSAEGSRDEAGREVLDQGVRALPAGAAETRWRLRSSLITFPAWSARARFRHILEKHSGSQIQVYEAY